MAQRSVFVDKACTILEDGDDNVENQWELEGHLANDSLSPNTRRMSADSRSYAIMTRHRLQRLPVRTSWAAD